MDRKEVGPASEYTGERLLGFYGGKNQGTVIQWLRPSHNKKVIRAGLRVKAREDLTTFRQEISRDPGSGEVEGLVNFLDPIAAGMTGTVVFMMNGGRVVTSGNAVVVFDLPSYMEGTLNAGASSGPVVVLSSDFGKLDVVEDSSVPQSGTR